MRAEVWSPLQNTAVWLGAWLHGYESSDALVDALRDLGGLHQLADGCGLSDFLHRLRQVAATSGPEPAAYLVLSGPGEAPALSAGSQAAALAARGVGALVFLDRDKAKKHILVPDYQPEATIWHWFEHLGSLPATPELNPGQADEALSEATNAAADLIEKLGYRSDALNNPRLTIGALNDFYDTPGLPSSTPSRAAKLFARADRVAAIVETVTARIGDHSFDPQLLSLWRHIRAARMAGVKYCYAEFARG